MAAAKLPRTAQDSRPRGLGLWDTPPPRRMAAMARLWRALLHDPSSLWKRRRAPSTGRFCQVTKERVKGEHGKRWIYILHKRTKST
jgi:hypothetical protein